MVFAHIAKLPPHRPARSSSIEPVPPTQAEIAARLNVGIATGKRAKHVLANGTPELAHAVEHGKIDVFVAAKLGGSGARGRAYWRILAGAGGTFRQLAESLRRRMFVPETENPGGYPASFSVGIVAAGNIARDLQSGNDRRSVREFVRAKMACLLETKSSFVSRAVVIFIVNSPNDPYRIADFRHGGRVDVWDIKGETAIGKQFYVSSSTLCSALCDREINGKRLSVPISEGNIDLKCWRFSRIFDN